MILAVEPQTRREVQQGNATDGVASLPPSTSPGCRDVHASAANVALSPAADCLRWTSRYGNVSIAP